MRQPAHINDMGRLFLISILVLLSLAFILFVPIVIQTDFHYDVNGKKAGFAVYIYKIFKIIGGYIQTYQGGLALHVSKKNAFLIPYSQMDSERKKFSFVRSFRLIAFTLTTETGAEYLLPVSIAQTVLRGYFLATGGEKDNVENNLWLTDGDVFRISLHSAVYFTVFMLLCNLIKFLKEKITSIWQTKTKKSII